MLDGLKGFPLDCQGKVISIDETSGVWKCGFIICLNDQSFCLNDQPDELKNSLLTWKFEFAGEEFMRFSVEERDLCILKMSCSTDIRSYQKVFRDSI